MSEVMNAGKPATGGPDDWWVDDFTGEYVNSVTGERLLPIDARARICGEQA